MRECLQPPPTPPPHDNIHGSFRASDSGASSVTSNLRHIHVLQRLLLVSMCVHVCVCVHFRALCDVQSALSGQRGGMQMHRKHTCVTHTRSHTHMPTPPELYTQAKKTKTEDTVMCTPQTIPPTLPTELFKCNIVTFEPVLGCGYSW